MGYNAGGSLTTGHSNIAIGAYALDACTTSSHNTAIGNAALSAGTGLYNTAVGSGSMQTCTTGTRKTAIGYGLI